MPDKKTYLNIALLVPPEELHSWMLEREAEFASNKFDKAIFDKYKGYMSMLTQHCSNPMTYTGMLSMLMAIFEMLDKRLNDPNKNT